MADFPVISLNLEVTGKAYRHCCWQRTQGKSQKQLIHHYDSTGCIIAPN